MNGRFSWVRTALLTCAFLAGGAFADDGPPYGEWGKALFEENCASCHGVAGAGNGPVADSLKTAPADLTLISAAHEGKFPRDKVMRFIDGRADVMAHGSREMPVWGVAFREQGSRIQAAAAIYALTEYVETLQKKK